MYFMSLRINLSAYSQGKTFTSAKDKDESSKSAHLTCKQITIEHCDLVEGWTEQYHGQHAPSYSTTVGVRSNWLVSIMTLLNNTPELKHIPHEFVTTMYSQQRYGQLSKP